MAEPGADKSLAIALNYAQIITFLFLPLRALGQWKLHLQHGDLINTSSGLIHGLISRKSYHAELELVFPRGQSDNWHWLMREICHFSTVPGQREHVSWFNHLWLGIMGFTQFLLWRLFHPPALIIWSLPSYCPPLHTLPSSHLEFIVLPPTG